MTELESIFENACLEGNIEGVISLQLEVDKNTLIRGFEEAMYDDQYHIVDLLLSDKTIDYVDEYINTAFDWNDSKLLKILLDSEKIDDPFAFDHLYETSNIDIMKVLLSSMVLRPRHVYPITNAVKNDDIDMLRLLLSDGKFDPSDCGNDPIYYALMNCNFQMIELLLSDPRVDPFEQLDTCFCEHSTKLLLSLDNFDANYGQIMLEAAVHEKDMDIIHILLQNHTVQQCDLSILKDRYPELYIKYKLKPIYQLRQFQRSYLQKLYLPTSSFIINKVNNWD